MSSRPAVFLDRDDTINRDSGFISNPDDMRLLDTTVPGLLQMQEMGFALVVVTNQAGIAYGLMDEDAVQAVNARMVELLSAAGVELDGVYYCPYHREGKVEAYRRDSDMRKPGAGMLLQAAEELDLDLSRSWMAGDRDSDVRAGRAAGCRTIRIVAAGTTPEGDAGDYQAGDLVEAASIIRSQQSETL